MPKKTREKKLEKTESRLRLNAGHDNVQFARYVTKQGRFYTGPWHTHFVDAVHCNATCKRRVNSRMVRKLKYTRYLDLGKARGVVCLVEDDIAEDLRES